MPYNSLADFLEELERCGQLRRITVEVDPDFEISEICQRLAHTDGPAVLFERVRGHATPVVANLLATRERICKAAGVESLEEIAERLERLLKPELPHGWLDSLKMVPYHASLAKLPPRLVSAGPCQQVVRLASDVNLFELPLGKAWPEDAGPVITAGQVYTRSPESRQRNVGACPIRIVGRNELALCWQPHQGGARHFNECARRGEMLPVAIALGGDPLLHYIATAPMPPEVDECLLAGFLRGKAVDLVRCRSIDSEAPADAEFVLEGQVDPREATIDPGSFALPTGFYSQSTAAVRMHVTAVTHRANPLFPHVVACRPPNETNALAKATERIFLPLLRIVAPEVVDFDLPASAGPNSIAFVAIRKTYPGQAHKVASALWGFDPLMFTRLIVLVDAHVNVHDLRSVMFQMGANVHPGRDVIFRHGPSDGWNHAVPAGLQGQQMAFDATAKLPGEHPRAWPAESRMTQEIKDLVSGRWEEYGIDVAEPKKGKRAVRAR